MATDLVSEAELVNSGELAHMTAPSTRREYASNSAQQHLRMQSVTQRLGTPVTTFLNHSMFAVLQSFNQHTFLQEALAPGDTTRPDKSSTLTDSNSVSSPKQQQSRAMTVSVLLLHLLHFQKSTES